MAGTPPASCGRRDGTYVFLEDGPSAPSCGPEPQGQHGLPRHLQLSPPPPSAPPPGYPSETPVPEGRRGVALTHPDPPRTAPGRMAGPLGAQRPHPWKGIGKPTLVRAKRVRKPPDPHGGAEPASVTGRWRPQGHWRWGEPASLRLFRGRAPAPSSPQARSASLTSCRLPPQDGNSVPTEGSHPGSECGHGVDTNLEAGVVVTGETPGGPRRHCWPRPEPPAAPVWGRARSRSSFS